MSLFYTNVCRKGNKILVRGYKDGVRFKYDEWYSPTLYYTTTKQTSYRDIFGKYVSPKRFDDMWGTKKFIEDNDDVDGFDVYGLDRHEYAFINENFRNCEPDTSKIKVCYLDIENKIGVGKVDPYRAANPITAISMVYKDITFALAYKEDYQPKEEDVKYIKCKDEADLLEKFLKIWSSDSFGPDVVTGWNVQLYDIPYIYNRIGIVLGEDQQKKLSPWNVIRSREVNTKFSKEKQIVYNILGIEIIDYMDAYKKFITSGKPKYSLEYIAEEELGEKKVSYRPEYKNLDDLYERNFPLYMDYNIKDSKLVQRLEEALGFLDLMYTVAYETGTNYSDAFGTVTQWDVAIHNHLIEQNIVIPTSKSSAFSGKPIGGFVKEPIGGRHDWVVSYDVTSMYPMTIIGYNISPETLVKYDPGIIEEDIVSGKFKRESTQDNVIAPNGSQFTKMFQGFLPKLMEELFEKRYKYKKKMQEHQELYEKDHRESDKILAKRYEILQLATKVRLNGLYGALANNYFRWNDLRLAEAITTAGRTAIKWAAKYMNAYLNRYLGTDNEDYVLYCDTDSMYICFEKVVEKSGLTDTNEIIDYLDDFSKNKVQKALDAFYVALSKKMNCYKQAMQMKREVICDRAVFVAKKKYILNVWDNEGLRYEEPKRKATGIEAVRSSTPDVVRKYIENVLDLILNGEEDDAQKYAKEKYKEYCGLGFEEIAFPRSVNNLEKYSDPHTIYGKGTPIQVRGSLLYNHYVKEAGIESEYDLITDGNKIAFCYLRMPNPINENVIACPGPLPKEFGLEEYIDHDVQFEKAFNDPLDDLMKAVGWKNLKSNTIRGLFK